MCLLADIMINAGVCACEKEREYVCETLKEREKK